MLPFCKGHRVSDPFRLFFPAPSQSLKAQPESQTRPQEISLFAEGFGKKRHIDGRGKRIPLRGPAIEQKRPHRAGFRALKPHQNPMLPFCKGHRVSDPFRLFFPARL
jgi:hypothetical protein